MLSAFAALLGSVRLLRIRRNEAAEFHNVALYWRIVRRVDLLCVRLVMTGSLGGAFHRKMDDPIVVLVDFDQLEIDRFRPDRTFAGADGND